MENSAGKSFGAEIARRSRSLDIQSLYKSSVPKTEGDKKRKSVAEHDGEIRKKKRKIRKEVSLSSFEAVGEKSVNSVDEAHGEGVCLDLPNSEGSESGFSRKLDIGRGFHGISHDLDDSSNAVRVPKRRRGFMGRKKCDSKELSRPLGQSSSRVSVSDDQISKLSGECGKLEASVVSKRLRPPCGKASSLDQLTKLKADFGGKVVAPKLNRELANEGSKDNSVAGVSSACDDKVEDGHATVDNSGASSGKHHDTHRKRKNLASGRESVEKVVQSLDDSLIKKDDDLKHNQIDRVISAGLNKVEDDHPIVDNGDVSSRKHRGTHRKKDLASGSKSLRKVVKPLADGVIKKYNDSQDEDEENLEQNAARMLSSRFDPSCTRSSKCRSSGSPRRNGLTFFVPSDEEFVSRGVSSLAGLESASGDTASRVLRPRKTLKEKGLLRKRRHFYEILSRDLDAYWVLNRRIKVFWPLDESWYYGLVNDYDPERKLHHIKYDDRDEEWVNLHNERFKLLLLRSEVPSKTDYEGATLSKHQDNDLANDDDSLIGSYMESEPIISWLARASCRVSSSTLGSSKRQKTSHTSPTHLPLMLSTKSDDANGCSNSDSMERNASKPSCDSALLDRYAESSSMLEGTGTLKEGKLPVVYYRRRFRSRDKVYSDTLENGHTHGSGTAPSTSSAPIVHGFRASGEFDFSLGHTEPVSLLWSFDNSGLLKLTMPLGKYRQFRFELGILAPVFRYTFGVDNSWLLHSILLLQYGAVLNTWPKVFLELLFVDNLVGLRFLLLEGCLKQVVAFVFLVLRVFCQPNMQGKHIDMSMPVTSIRFKISSVEDIRKQQTFTFYGFSKLKYWKWLYLDNKLQRHCLLSKRLPLSECTYDNIKALGGVSYQLGREPAFQGFQKKSIQEIMPTGVGASRETCSVVMNQSSTSDARLGNLLPFTLSFAAAPTFFLSMHLKLLMENCVASISLQDHGSVCSLEHSGTGGHASSDGRSLSEDRCKSVSDVILEANTRTCLVENKSSGWFPSAKSQLVTATTAKCANFCQGSSSHKFPNGKLSVDGSSTTSRYTEEIATAVVAQSQNWVCSRSDLEQFVELPQPSVTKDEDSVDLPDSRCYSPLAGLSVEIPSVDQVEKPVPGQKSVAAQCADLAWNRTGGTVRSPNITGPRTMWHRNENSSTSSIENVSHVWPDGKADFMRNGFGNGPKKPRTQVKYTLPFGGFDFSSKQRMHNQRGLPFKRIRKSNEKSTSNSSKSSPRNLELLACNANVLITVGDKGWREYGARIVLELADHNEWRLAVKLAGTTKYSYKAHQFLQNGSTNRYTHAMMWKGGKDWALEFPDRSQWMLFKEMHEECYNRNARAASVKNIPIPGVCLLEECDDNVIEVPFLRSSPKYIRHIGTDVDMATNPSHILYDMDSDDERWISESKKSKHSHEIDCLEISEELFEKTMDMFEKVAYARQCDYFTPDEIEEFMIEVGPMEVIKVVHEHWRLKRQRKGMALIRHLQPPLWERYEQQVKEWEQAMTKSNSILSNGSQEKAPSMEKPPMFAFCLKPRGLEVPNKGSKHRSQKKFPVSGHSHGVLVDQDVLHAFAGRRSNGFAFGDEKVMFQGNGYESSDASPVFRASTRAFSPRDASGSGHFSLGSDWSEWNHHPRLYRNKSKKMGTFSSPHHAQMVASYNQRTSSNRSGVHQWNTHLPEWRNQKSYLSEVSMRHGIEQLDGSDLDEFRLRDASGAAQHALNMAKLKREKAQRLLYRADLAIHKAVVSLMTAEAIKASFAELNGDDSNNAG